MGVRKSADYIGSVNKEIRDQKSQIQDLERWIGSINNRDCSNKTFFERLSQTPKGSTGHSLGISLLKRQTFHRFLGELMTERIRLFAKDNDLLKKYEKIEVCTNNLGGLTPVFELKVDDLSILQFNYIDRYYGRRNQQSKEHFENQFTREKNFSLKEIEENRKEIDRINEIIKHPIKERNYFMGDYSIDNKIKRYYVYVKSLIRFKETNKLLVKLINESEERIDSLYLYIKNKEKTAKDFIKISNKKLEIFNDFYPAFESYGFVLEKDRNKLF